MALNLLKKRNQEINKEVKTESEWNKENYKNKYKKLNARESGNR